jgi:Tfp pilus assembly PilM family ATPase
MAKTAVGIYISEKSVDIVELAGSKNAPVFLNFIRQEIPPAPASIGTDIAEKKPSEQDPIAVAVKEGLEKLNLKPHAIQTVLASNDVMIRYFDMPLLPKSEQPQAVRFEAKKYVPFKLEEITSDFRILTEPDNKNVMGIFFIAVTKARVNSHIAKFKDTGAVVVGIDIIPFALWRALLLHKKVALKDRLVVLYADNDRESVSIHIMESGIPFMSRDFKIATDDKEAAFEKIISELRVSMDYYGRQKRKAEISKIITCGEMLFSGLDAYIADELKIATSTLYDFNKVKNADKVLPSAIAAFGSALEGLGKSNYSVNFSPLSATIKHKKTHSIIAIEVIAAAAIMMLFYLFNSFLIKNTATELKAIKKEAGSFPVNTSLLSLKKLITRKESMLKDTEFLRLIVNNRVSWAGKLVSIANNLPATNREIPGGVWINSLIIKEDFILSDSIYPSGITRKLFISGSSFLLNSGKETVYINRFFKVLKKDAIFMDYLNNIDLGSVNKKDMEGYQVSAFTISAYSGGAVYTGNRPSLSKRAGRR